MRPADDADGTRGAGMRRERREEVRSERRQRHVQPLLTSLSAGYAMRRLGRLTQLFVTCSCSAAAVFLSWRRGMGSGLRRRQLDERQSRQKEVLHPPSLLPPCTQNDKHASQARQPASQPRSADAGRGRAMCVCWYGQDGVKRKARGAKDEGAGELPCRRSWCMPSRSRGGRRNRPGRVGSYSACFVWF